MLSKGNEPTHKGTPTVVFRPSSSTLFPTSATAEPPSPPVALMGGDPPPRYVSTSSEEESSVHQDFSGSLSPGLSFLPGHSDAKVMGGGEHNFVPEELLGAGRRISATSLECEATEKNKRRVYREMLQSYDQLYVRSEALDDLKTKILSYRPGRWVESSREMKCSHYNVPETTTLLVVGSKGCGKSSLVNRISKVFEKDKFVSQRAQVSCNRSVGDGTYFLQEYAVPRDSTSICLYDTRGLSDDTSDNIDMLKQLMTKGVRNGRLITRPSDSSSLITRMKGKARQSGCWSGEKKKVNFVIFVVNGLEVLKAMDTKCEQGTKYTQMIATIFNSPYLSFKDDKPVVVVTHGDLISLADRALVRVHLGDLLGVPPATQVFDIPESCDPATELAIAHMLGYALEHADKHLPHSRRGSLSEQARVQAAVICACLIILIGMLLAYMIRARSECSRKSKVHVDWASIRHLWLG